MGKGRSSSKRICVQFFIIVFDYIETEHDISPDMSYTKPTPFK